MIINPKELRTILVTDCGSTTTKAVLFELKSDGWRQTFRGEAPTTVENPVADVTVGALNAFKELEELSSRKILSDNLNQNSLPFIVSSNDGANPQNIGIDLYLSTSSAGGGLQMIVTGLVSQMTTQSAERAALGAGAIVLDAISADDGREEYERIERIRHLKPDIVLITGGVDGGDKSHAIEAAEVLLSAAPKPRFGDTLKLPVIFAGNKEAAKEVEQILASFAHVQSVPNVRPSLEREELEGARHAIHEFFLSHVMSHAPGYSKLLDWTPKPVLPTPSAFGDMVIEISKRSKLSVLAVDIGGATTDLFSALLRSEQTEPIFNRTVSANLGMSYSIANVLVEAGVDNIARWLPFELSHSEIRDRLRNKMIRPTSIPQSLDDLLLEQAVCREALRLSLKHHRSLATGLKGLKKERGIADIFLQRGVDDEKLDINEIDLVIGSGGALSHAPDRKSAALMMIDAFELSGLTEIAVDSIFMMPHLGVFASVHPEAAHQILMRDCLIKLAHVIAPIFPTNLTNGTLLKVTIDRQKTTELQVGEIKLIKLPVNTEITLRIEPIAKGLDLGSKIHLEESGRILGKISNTIGASAIIERTIKTGELGVILDGRNRPLSLNRDAQLRRANQRSWNQALGIQECL